MAALLLELFSEEIPARMQAGGAKEFERLVVGALSDRGLLFEGVKTFAGPRRLTLAVAGLSAVQPDVSEERKGPRVGAPDKAIEGFLRSAGVTLDQCVRHTDAKGEFYVAVIRRMGRASGDVLAEVLPQILAQFSWPKSMRWRQGTQRWVRPLHGIVCTLDGEIVDFEFAGIRSGNTTRGHRFLSSGEIQVRRFDDYEQKLATAHVVLDPMQRREIISHEAAQKAFALGLAPVEDEALLREIVGLVEWPVVLIGTIDEEFLSLPPEVLQTSMRVHQKFLALRNRETGLLSNRFLTVANIIAADGGAEIIAGNERVLRARLADARFFLDQDRSRPLAARIPELGNIVYHAKAGTMLDRAFRIALLAAILARRFNFDREQSCRSALLAKADLVSGMVVEFPELQGIMGGHYALQDGESQAVADAIREHYQPLGPGDRVPQQPVAIAVALADKIDSLVVLWSAGEKPTGSKDPFALRRAGLGIIRILLENRLRLPLRPPMRAVLMAMRANVGQQWDKRMGGPDALDHIVAGLNEEAAAICDGDRNASPQDREAVSAILEFLADRLKVALRDKGVRHDLIDAIFSLGGEDDLVRLVARVEALQLFLDTADGTNLLVAYRRAVNIVRIEEKRDGCSYQGEPDRARVEAPEEKRLFAALTAAREQIASATADERFADAMTFMAALREPVDVFFEKVTVNAPDADLRRNRLLLLSLLRSVMHTVADFSRIEG